MTEYEPDDEKESDLNRREFMSGVAGAAGVGSASTISDEVERGEPKRRALEKTGLTGDVFAHIHHGPVSYEFSALDHDESEAEWVIDSYLSSAQLIVSLDHDSDGRQLDLGAELSPDDAEALGSKLIQHARALREAVDE